MLVIFTGDHGIDRTVDQNKWFGYNYADRTDFLGEYGITTTIDGVKAASWAYDINEKVKEKFPTIVSDILPYTITYRAPNYVMTSDYVFSNELKFRMSSIPSDVKVQDVEEYVASKH
jgi:hypothetical protein